MLFPYDQTNKVREDGKQELKQLKYYYAYTAPPDTGEDMYLSYFIHSTTSHIVLFDGRILIVVAFCRSSYAR
jgi:hypothetical protein